MSDFRDTLYTINKRGERNWVYPELNPGTWRTVRTVTALILMVFYLVMPWITIGGEQGILLDIPSRKFIFFGNVFWATDTEFLAIILASLGLTLFFFTALFGRIWCGWACPETVFLEFLFRPIEQFIEGGPVERKRLDALPWSLKKARLKATKFLIFAVLAWLIASTFLAYFVGAKPLIQMMSDYPWINPTPFFATVFMMGLMLFQFGWFREQFCTVVCPYARFQSVLLDSDSLLVGYDRARGEPRGKIKKGDEKGSLGDCIDCGLCVRVCPTGIDIRNGLQLECIQCAACADACDSIMLKIGRAPGLVRYSTERALETGTLRLARPRVLIYATILVLLGSAFVYLLRTRDLSEFQVMRQARVETFQEVSPGVFSNQFKIHISNKDRETRTYTISIDTAAATIIMPGAPYTVAGGTETEVPVFVHFPLSLLHNGTYEAVVTVSDDKGFRGTQRLPLIGPVQP